MKFDDIFGDEDTNESPKQEPKRALPVDTGKKKEDAKPRKSAVEINKYVAVGLDKDGKPIKSWVPRERQIIAGDIIQNLRKQSVEVFNTNGFLSSYDNSTDNWYIYDEPTKVGVLIDTHIVCWRKKHEKSYIVSEPLDCPKNVNEYLTFSRDIISSLGKVLGVARHPYFDSKLNIVNKAGYNPDTQYYLPESSTIDKDAHKITIQEAHKIFEETFGSMNYKTDIDKQAEFACFLTPPWRMLVENTPIVSVTANVPGSGKGLRQKVFDAVWNKGKGATLSKPKSEDELRKQLFAALKSGVCHISIDNISNKLLSDVLATYATETPISDRAVYGRTIEQYDNILLISVNGNNLRFSSDIAERLLPIHLDINQSSLVRDYKAEGRKTAVEILNYARKNRDKIMGASLRISQEYIDKGMPDLKTGVSRFEKWRRCVLGATRYAFDTLKIDYLLNGVVVNAKRESDPEGQARATLFKAILDVIGVEDNDTTKSKPFVSANHEDYGVFDLASHFDKLGRKTAEGHNLLGEFIDSPSERGRMTQVGKYFRDVAMDKIHYGWRLVLEPQQLRVNRAPKPTYRLILVSEDSHYVPGTENWQRPGVEDDQQENPLDHIPLA